MNFSVATQHYHHTKTATHADALSYLTTVKRLTTNTNPTIYPRLISLMERFKNDLVDVPNVIVGVKSLFGEMGQEERERELLEGFERFLPEGYTMQLQLTEQASSWGDHEFGEYPFESYDSSSSSSSSGDSSDATATPTLTLTPTATTVKRVTKLDPTLVQLRAIHFIQTVKCYFANDPHAYFEFLKILLPSPSPSPSVGLKDWEDVR